MNEWPVKSSRATWDNKDIEVNQSYDLAGRIALAKDFAACYHFEPPMLISPPDLLINFELVYKPWPFRIYGFDGFDVGFASEPKDCETYVCDVVRWIEL
jgi:hypothetical protein